MSEISMDHLALSQKSFLATESDSEWFAVSVRPRSEKVVAAQLALRQVEHFLPLLAEKHRWSDRLKTVHVPLFPGYVFVQIQNLPERLVQVLRIPGALHFVGNGNAATPIPPGEIEALRRIFDHDVPFESHQFLQVGERVRVHGGCMEGVEGVLADRTRQTLVLSVNAIQRSVAVSIQDFSFERI